MATIQRLEAVPGGKVPRPVEAPESWATTPGVYVRRDREVVDYLEVTPSEVRQFSDADEAARLVYLKHADELTQIANDVVADTRDDNAPQVPGAPKPVLAREFLKARGLDWQVRSERIRRQDAVEPGAELTPVIDEWQAIVHERTGDVLHVATNYYHLVQHTDCLALVDFAVSEDVARYVEAYQTERTYRAHRHEPSTGDEIRETRTVTGETIMLRFELPSQSRTWVRAGGALSTSHDGSSAIRATACLTIGGVVIFHRVTDSWKHSRKVAQRLTFGRAAMEFLLRSLDALVQDAEAARGVSDVEAAEIVLREVAPELWAEPGNALSPAEKATFIKLRDEKRAKALGRLYAKVQAIDALRGPDAEHLGGLRFVIAAPYALSNRASQSSLVFGGARERMSNALVALARFAGIEGAGLVPDEVVGEEGGAS